jgi:hypothetical protein
MSKQFFTDNPFLCGKRGKGKTQAAADTPFLPCSHSLWVCAAQLRILDLSRRNLLLREFMCVAAARNPLLLLRLEQFRAVCGAGRARRNMAVELKEFSFMK